METRKRTRRAETSNAAAQQPEGIVGISSSHPPVPRRSAPRGRGPAASIASIPTQQGVDSDEAEESGTEEEGAEAAVGPASDAEQDVIGQASENAASANSEEHASANYLREMMIATLPDLDHGARELIKLLGNPSYNDRVFLSRLQYKRNSLREVGELYEDAEVDKSSLLSLSYVRELELGQEGHSTLLRANIATTLSNVERALHDADFELVSFLEDLNKYATQRLIEPRDFPQSGRVALDMRTQFLIVKYALGRINNASKLIISVFCDDSVGLSQDEDVYLSEGPFRSLGSNDQQREADECFERITKLALLLKDVKGKKQAAIAKLRSEFPLAEFLHDLRRWLLSQNEMLNARDGQEMDIFQDALDEINSSVAESQAITRAAPGQIGFVTPNLFEKLDTTKLTHHSPSLFRGEESVRALKEPQADESDPYAFEDDDDFQTDKRPFEIRKRHSEPGRHRVSKRARISRPPRSSLAAGSMGPPPRPSTLEPSFRENRLTSSLPPVSVLPPSSTDYDAITTRKREMTNQARAASQQGPQRQRQPWSERDCNLLLHLTQKHNASWSLIEKHENRLFEYPRNQQAYRDKARNLKVDFLLTDTILPPGFDLVMLGPKEIRKLVAMGKNPYRRERDNGDGEPTNTNLRREEPLEGEV